jgi:hypothetical protein
MRSALWQSVSLVSPELGQNHKTLRDKRSSLFVKNLLTPAGAIPMKLFTAIIYEFS